MAHEITNTDNVVLTKRPAWHNLGVVVNEAPTPTDALRIGGLNWNVEQWPLYATNGEHRVVLDQVANVRSDTRESLGVVSFDWTPFQNQQVAEFCEALAEQGDRVTVESVGSIRGGRKVWFLLQAESFAASHDDDIVQDYLCVSNGFDGSTGLRVTPTSVRVVCSNTLHAVIPETLGRKTVDVAGFSCSHMGDLQARVEQAKQALKLYGRTMEYQRAVIDNLAAKKVNSEQVQRFFLECYTRDFQGIPEAACRKRDKAVKAVRDMTARFDRESSQFGANAWILMNAYTGWLQNDRPARVKDATKQLEQRQNSKLFGTDAKRSVASFSLAHSLAV